MSTLRMIAGLGNPDAKYERTLHNAGFWFVDELARRYNSAFKYEKKFDAECCKVAVDGNDIWLVKPQSYMNHSAMSSATAARISCASGSASAIPGRKTG
jgi:PTH1 family peptidyl-tRNA hydrolase